MSLAADFISEPLLAFGNGQSVENPRMDYFSMDRSKSGQNPSRSKSASLERQRGLHFFGTGSGY